MQEDQVVFPPMDEAAFAEKLAKWQARGPKKFVPKNSFGRVAHKRIPKAQFQDWILAQMEGRATYQRKHTHIPLRKDVL